MVLNSSTQVAVQVGKQGHLLIPDELRQRLDLKPGDTLMARLEEGRLILEKHEAISQRLKARFAHLPPERSLADELIAERRKEAHADAVE